MRFGSKPLTLINEVFIYMISTSYFLGNVAYQVNGFVQDFFNTFLQQYYIKMNEWWNQ